MHVTQAEIEEKTEQNEEESEDEGGLDLEEAKRRMEEEDKIDKEIYRERVKRRHRVSHSMVDYNRICVTQDNFGNFT